MTRSVPGPNDAKRLCHKPNTHELDEAVRPVYWKSLEELESASAPSSEFPGGLPILSDEIRQPKDTRRDFLSLMGFTLAAAALGGCRAPVEYAVPSMAGSDQITPGVASWYATTCGACPSACSLLAKQRDGRPIKIEGNDRSTLFGGGTCATGQAALLSLYDNERLREPHWHGRPIRWQQLDEQVTDSFGTARRQGRQIVLLSSTLNSPSTLEIIGDWARQFPNFRHVVYDAVSLSALRAANAECFGRAVVPHYAFDKARIIVGLEADFLGTWLSPVEFARQYAQTRAPEGEPSLHIQFESGLSVTGSNADLRVPVAPSEIGPIAVSLLCRIAERAGVDSVARPQERNAEKLDAVANQLWRHRGKSLIVSGIQDKSLQVVVNTLNMLLGNIGVTIDLTRHRSSTAATIQLWRNLSKI